MRILCDQTVNWKYVETFRRTEWITVTTVRDTLKADARDDEIGRYPAMHDRVIFTEDDDHLEVDRNWRFVRETDCTTTRYPIPATVES